VFLYKLYFILYKTNDVGVGCKSVFFTKRLAGPPLTQPRPNAAIYFRERCVTQPLSRQVARFTIDKCAQQKVLYFTSHLPRKQVSHIRDASATSSATRAAAHAATNSNDTATVSRRSLKTGSHTATVWREVESHATAKDAGARASTWSSSTSWWWSHAAANTADAASTAATATTATATTTTSPDPARGPKARSNSRCKVSPLAESQK